MLKKIVFILTTAISIAGCKNNNIEVKGKLQSPVKGEFIYLDELRSTELITIDSAEVEADGSFSFNRKLLFPSFYLLKTDETNFLMMLLEPGQAIEIRAWRDSLNYPIRITGSPGTELMNQYNLKLQGTQTKLKRLYDDYMRNLGSDQLASVMEKLDSVAQIYLDDLNAYTKNYIDQNINSLVSLVALYQQVAPGEYILHPEKDLEYFIKVDSAMTLRYPDYEPVRSLHNQVTGLVKDVNAQNLEFPVENGGTIAPEISLPGPNGDTIRLSSTRGNIVLLDFWASWCRPCRNENPNLVKAYEKYHNQGFQIYQVSLDKTREAWINGISEDNLGKWIHVSDIKYWQSVVVELYSLEFIPANFLIDREGRIIASNLSGETLQAKLAEIFQGN